MDYSEAFNLLKGRVQSLQRFPRGAMTQGERDEEDALVIALQAMRDFSGCFHPDEVIRVELPHSRADAALDLVLGR